MEIIKDHQVKHFNINTLIIIYKMTIHNSLHFNWVLSGKCFLKNRGAEISRLWRMLSVTSSLQSGELRY